MNEFDRSPSPKELDNSLPVAEIAKELMGDPYGEMEIALSYSRYRPNHVADSILSRPGHKDQLANWRPLYPDPTVLPLLRIGKANYTSNALITPYSDLTASALFDSITAKDPNTALVLRPPANQHLIALYIKETGDLEADRAYYALSKASDCDSLIEDGILTAEQAAIMAAFRPLPKETPYPVGQLISGPLVDGHIAEIHQLNTSQEVTDRATLTRYLLTLLAPYAKGQDDSILHSMVHTLVDNGVKPYQVIDLINTTDSYIDKHYAAATSEKTSEWIDPNE